MSKFDTMVAADNPFFLSEVGDSVTFQAVGNPANNKTISIIKVDEKPRFMASPSGDEEHYECEVLVSNRNDTEGQVTITILGFAAQQACDQIVSLHGLGPWYVIDRDDDNDPSFHHLILRTKQFPKDYQFGG